ncbi:OsmC family peroxiredoxin [Solirhodobacter olei]|uniref:OsmC family peroxiredoxin n=1 Tax=Solirhodobacter olei TaxID=2493082 RepID=UPI000FD9A12C|nr:OsmC family peroxiredoxin [Solirhodobacter olei]
MIRKSASANWDGGLKGGSGTISTQSGVLKDASYSFATRFEDKVGTNPEELVGAAHAACFAMFLSALMEGADVAGGSVKAKSTITLDPSTEGSPTVTAAHLDVTIMGDAPDATLKELADTAKAGCPISKLLKAEVTMTVTLG